MAPYINKPEAVELPFTSRVKSFGTFTRVSAAILDDNSCWVWGRFKSRRIIRSPQRVPLHLVDESIVIPCIQGFVIMSYKSASTSCDGNFESRIRRMYYFSRERDSLEPEVWTTSKEPNPFRWLRRKFATRICLELTDHPIEHDKECASCREYIESLFRTFPKSESL